MYFDGAARHDGARAGVVFASPERHVLPYSFVLTQLCSNNMDEYQALILGLQLAIEMGIQDLDVHGDSQLVISQILSEYEVKKEDLIPYHKHASRLLDKFDTVRLPRSANKMADALAGLAATLALGAEETMYGVPQRIVTDNGKTFVNNLMNNLFQKFKFTQHKPSMYNAPANGLAEAFNKTLCNLLSKVVAKSKRDWHEKIGEALWAYRTIYKNATQSTPSVKDSRIGILSRPFLKCQVYND
uniref:Uncharacterized protein n=1 Tax=Chenopodium quinoa TaxID=63459 RepID=A0A803L7Q4_CHEQI